MRVFHHEKSILEESVEREWSTYENAPEHKFSLKHRLAMKKIFKLYEKNTECLRPKMKLNASKPKTKLTLKSALFIVLMIFLAALVGCTAAYFISQSFRGDVHNDFTRIFPINTENCPATIKEKYYLSELPEEFEILEEDLTPHGLFIGYKNITTGQTITFSQSVKTGYGTKHFNTENHKLEEIEINGNYGLCLDFSDDERTDALVLWDNGDYIFEVAADLTKKETVNLAKSAKVLEN